MIDSAPLRSLMRENGLTQAELARRVGTSQPSIYRLATGETTKSPLLHKIAQELGTTPAYLSGDTNDPAPNAALPEPVSSEEREWVRHLHGMMPKDRTALLQIARSLASSAATPMVQAQKMEFRHQQGE